MLNANAQQSGQITGLCYYGGEVDQYCSYYDFIKRDYTNPDTSCGRVFLYKYERYGGFQGEWRETNNEKNGAPIYRKDIGIYGIWYLWFDAVYGYKGWAIGPDPNNPGSKLGWKWGDSLFGSGWLYRDLKNIWKWYYDSDAMMLCSDYCNSYECCCDAAIPSNYALPNMTIGAEMAADPPLPEDWSDDGVSSDSGIHEIVAGAAVGVLALAVIAIAVSVIRKWKNAPKSAASVPIAELSPTDIAVQTEMGNKATIPNVVHVVNMSTNVAVENGTATDMVSGMDAVEVVAVSDSNSDGGAVVPTAE